MQQVNIIQFLPYFPPHAGGIENIAASFSSHYTKAGYGQVINIVFDVGQEYNNTNLLYIFSKDNTKIGYKKDNYIVYLLPSFEIIPNFPIPKFFKKEYREIFAHIKNILANSKEPYIVQTHTRFFLSSFLGGIFACKNKLKWIHVEHGSDFVKLGSKIKTCIAYMYDKTIGKWIFKKTHRVVAVSNGCKNFILNNFFEQKKIEVIYNGIDFEANTKILNKNKIILGYIGRLVSLKGVELLLEAYKKLSVNNTNLELLIIGDGDEKNRLIHFVKKNKLENVSFLGYKNIYELENDFFPKIDILINPSFQEGLPTVVIEGLLSKCVVIATDVGGTKEISGEKDLILFASGDSTGLEEAISLAILNYKTLSGKSYLHVKNTFSWEKNMRDYSILYNKLLDEK